MTDRVFESLAELSPVEPDARRSDRVRSRCHAVLARHRADDILGRRPRRLWEPLLAGLGGIYLAEIILQVLQVYGY